MLLHPVYTNNNNYNNVYGAIIMTKVIARVHPVHLMNTDWAPGGCQPFYASKLQLAGYGQWQNDA